MKQRKVTINLAWANVFALLLFAFVALTSSAAWYVLWGTPSFKDFGGSLLKDVNPLGAAVLVLIMLVFCAVFNVSRTNSDEKVKGKVKTTP